MTRLTAWFLVLFCLFAVSVPAVGTAIVSSPVLPQAMPPHPSLKERIARGEVQLPPYMTDPLLAQELGIDAAGAMPSALTGTINALAVVVDFDDNIHTVTATFFDSLIFALPVPGRGSVYDYFDEVSYGQVDIVTVDLPSSIGWVRAPNNYSYYVNGAYCTGAYPNNCQRLAENIVAAIDGVVDFSDYDNDDDGYMEPLMIVHAGPGAEFTGNPNDVWSHSWGLAVPQNLDGVTINRYVIMPEYWVTVDAATSDMTIGVFAHEMGHGFWSLPDLYDRNGPPNDSEGIGRWSLMASGSWNGPNSGGWGADGSSPAWPDAWSRIQMGFVGATDVLINIGDRSIPQAYDNPPPAETVLRLDSEALAATEYFLLENRQQVPGSYDQYLPGEGLFVWHVDDAMNISSRQNDYECTLEPHCNCSDSLHYLVALEQADGQMHMENNVNRGDAGDPFPGTTNNRSWTDATSPESSSWYACGDTCLRVTDISDSGATMTADLQISCALPAATWIGNTTSWGTGSNWSSGNVPDCGVNAIIPTTPSGGNYPTVNTDAEAAGLIIETGAQVNMSANTLGLCGNLDVQGTGQFNGTGGIVIFRRDLGQTIDMTAGANGQFYHLNIGNGTASPTVVVYSDLDVDGNVMIAPGATLVLGPNTLTLGGNWTEQGMFARDTSTVILNGSLQSAERYGQALILNEGFEGATFPPTGWQRYNQDGGGNQWVRSTTRAHTGSASAVHLYNFSQNEDGWLRTPSITLGIGPELRFWENVNWASYYVGHSLWACTGGCSTPPTNYTEVAEFANPQEDTWVERVVDLGAYAGQTVYLAFRYQGRNADDWYIDDVSVTSLETGGDLEFYNLAVNGSGISTFNGNVIVDNDLVIGNGATLDVGTYEITSVGASVTNDGSLRQTQDVPDAVTTSFLNIGAGRYYGLDIYPTSGGMGATTVTVYGNQPCSSWLGTAIQRCFEIDPETSQTADITFYYRDAEENGQDAANAYHWNGSMWQQEVGDGRDRSGVENNWVRATGVDSYSPFVLANVIPTGVELSRFEAWPDDPVIQVEWETRSEINIAGFNLYRSVGNPDGPWEQLNEDLIDSKVPPGSPLGAVYTYTDYAVLPDITYYYLLEDVDTIGISTPHGPVSATITTEQVFHIYLPAVLKD